MQKESAGLLIYKIENKNLKIFLVHPGGPFWKDKDLEAWSIPKGEIDFADEEKLDVAIRELEEEVGIKLDKEKINFIELGNVKQKAGKVVHCWAFEDNKNLWNGFFMKQNFIEIEWPMKSGKKIKIPEVDKAGFFNIETAKKKINPAQIEFIDRLIGNFSK